MDDVTIVGAGPAGSLAAVILARAGLRVRVFDRARFPRPKLCGDTLNPGSCATLSRHLPLSSLLPSTRSISGMLLTGPGGVHVRGLYGNGVNGYAVERYVLDHWLVEQAVAAGARVEQGCAIDQAIVEGGYVTGIRLRSGDRTITHRARLVIAADGRRSRLAFGLGLARHPLRPRRWAIGAYFEDVQACSDVGEMHVRRGHYIGVAPMPGGATNVCLVVQHDGGSVWRTPASMLASHLAADPQLGCRFVRARVIAPPVVLGPMAVDAFAAGVPGLLLAGDAAGFIDPMTGDGLTFALRGAELAAAVAIDVLRGVVDAVRAPDTLATARRAAFAGKWRFNRGVRKLVASAPGVGGAALVARVWPRAFERIIRFAGDA